MFFFLLDFTFEFTKLTRSLMTSSSCQHYIYHIHHPQCAQNKCAAIYTYIARYTTCAFLCIYLRCVYGWMFQSYHVYNTLTRWCTRPPQNAARRTLANRLLHWNSVRLSNRCYRQEERFGCGFDVCVYVYFTLFSFLFEHVLVVAMGRHNQICIRCLFICNIHIESVQRVLRPYEYAQRLSRVAP